ncbi:hypothetical protein [Kitasatospora griseola]|uniref:hypothetical protein n=1 Tax=Kitasatospora griseola TaxID=2064 RepID=UPI0037F42261
MPWWPSKGEPAVGARQTEVVRTASGRELTFRPVLTVVGPGRGLSRAGRLLVPGCSTTRTRT